METIGGSGPSFSSILVKPALLWSLHLIRSVDSLPEELQDFSVPMVIIGSDVEALYPSLDIDKVIKMVYEAVMKSKVSWEDLD